MDSDGARGDAQPFQTLKPRNEVPGLLFDGADTSRPAWVCSVKLKIKSSTSRMDRALSTAVVGRASTSSSEVSIKLNSIVQGQLSRVVTSRGGGTEQETLGVFVVCLETLLSFASL